MNALLVSASRYMHAFYVQISLKYSNHMKQFFFSPNKNNRSGPVGGLYAYTCNFYHRSTSICFTF